MIYLLRFCSEQPAWACSEQNLNKNHSRKIPATMIYFNFQCIEQTEEILNAFNLVIFHFLFDHLELDFSCSSEKNIQTKIPKFSQTEDQWEFQLFSANPHRKIFFWSPDLSDHSSLPSWQCSGFHLQALCLKHRQKVKWVSLSSHQFHDFWIFFDLFILSFLFQIWRER